MVTDMTTDVYADLLFLINAFMDCLCFLLTARLLRRRIRPWRLAVGCVLGGVYAVLALFPDVGRAAALVIDLCVCVLLCLTVFAERRDGLRALLPPVGVYLLVSLLLGGIMTGLYNLLNRAGCAGALSEGGDDGPTAWLFAVLALAGGAASLWGGRLFRRTGTRQTCTVTIDMNGRTAVLRGFVDTGNLLRDPMTGRAVIPVDRDAVAPLLSPALSRALDTRSHADLSAAPEGSRVRLIPAATAAGEGLLVGIRPDAIYVTVDGQAGGASDARALFAPTVIPVPSGIGEDGIKPEALVPSVLV